MTENHDDSQQRRERLSRLGQRVAELRLAIMFLTRLPVGHIDPLPRFADAMWAYPIAGAIHGTIMGLVFMATSWADLAAPIPALLAVSAGLLASGCFHEDGLADCADGFGGGLTREKKLTIMRDSRLGTYGSAALFMGLALKISLISNIADPALVLACLVGLGALTRGLLPLALRLLPASREDGMTAETADNLKTGVVVAAVLIGVGVLLAGLTVHQFSVAALIAVPLVVAAGMGVVLTLSWRQIQGVTGDVLGAAQVIGELSGLLAITLVLPS